jgi:hypothetical protein
VHRADQLGRGRHAEQRQRLVHLLAGRQQRRQSLPVLLGTVRRGDEGIPRPLGPAQLCPQLADTVLLAGGQGAPDGPTKLRDPVL